MHVNEIYAYQTFKPVDPILQEVLERAKKHHMPNIHVGAMDGQHIEVMIRMASYKKVSMEQFFFPVSARNILQGFALFKKGPCGHLTVFSKIPFYCQVKKKKILQLYFLIYIF